MPSKGFINRAKSGSRAASARQRQAVLKGRLQPQGKSRPVSEKDPPCPAPPASPPSSKPSS